MTPEQLIQTAQEISPNRLISDPEGALKSALLYLEALTLVKGVDAIEKPVQQPHTNGNGDDMPKKTPLEHLTNLQLAKRLMAIRKRHRWTVPQMCEALGLGVTSTTPYAWLKRGSMSETNRQKVIALLATQE